MEMTEHAGKRMNLFLGMAYEQKEMEFRKKFLLAGTPTLPWFYGLKLKDIPIFAQRCALFNVRILGFETSLDSNHTLHIITYEDYNGEFHSGWWKYAVNYFESFEVMDMIIPSIKVPVSVIEDYL
jgi:hypothetical protein